MRSTSQSYWASQTQSGSRRSLHSHAVAGKPPAILQAFFPLDRTADSNFVNVQVETAEALGVTIYHEVIVDDLGALNRGELDGVLGATAANYAAALTSGRHLLVAPLPEANLGEHPWGAILPDIDPDIDGSDRRFSTPVSVLRRSDSSSP